MCRVSDGRVVNIDQPFDVEWKDLTQTYFSYRNEKVLWDSVYASTLT